jgi:uncharacterized membrane protein YraQ (UPF0718 family)
MSAAAVGVALVDALRQMLLLTLSVAPYFLIGAPAGAALRAFVSQRWSEIIFGGSGI